MNTWVRICVHYTHSLNLNEFINLLDVRFSMKSETLMSSNCKQTSFFFYSYVFILEKVSPVSMKKSSIIEVSVRMDAYLSTLIWTE